MTVACGGTNRDAFKANPKREADGTTAATLLAIVNELSARRCGDSQFSQWHVGEGAHVPANRLVIGSRILFHRRRQWSTQLNGHSTVALIEGGRSEAEVEDRHSASAWPLAIRGARSWNVGIVAFVSSAARLALRADRPISVALLRDSINPRRQS